MNENYNGSPEEQENTGNGEPTEDADAKLYDDSDMKCAESKFADGDDDMKIIDDDDDMKIVDEDEDMKILDDDEDVVIFDGRKSKGANDSALADEKKEQGTDSKMTKPFDAIPPKKKKNKEEKVAPAGIKDNNEKTIKAAKATAKGTLFVARKIVTYLITALLTILLVGIITGAVVGVCFVIYIKNYVDPNYTGLDNLKFDSALSTTMYYVDETGSEVLLEDDTLVSSENRLWADYDDIPKILIDAYVAVEDQRFFEHEGVDMTRTASAVYNFFIPTSSSYGGGSTITQQLIKNVSGENSATIQRKVQEIFRAFNVESKYTKKEILEMYLNTIYLSHNSYGVRVAADTYFGKDLHELDLAECAAIASIGKWPSHYDPISNPNNNLTRRNLVLKLMLEQGRITEDQFNEAYDKPLKLADGTEESYTENVHSYYIDAVMDDVVDDLMAKYGYDEATASRVMYSGGLKIVTCLDPEIQSCVEKVYTDNSYWPEVNGMQAQSAICIMDPKTGNILAMAGGLGEKRESRGFNRATQAFRQCGSSIKPLSVYAYGLDNGYYKAGVGVHDVPPVYYPETDTYWPKAGTYRGMVSLSYAIRVSLNTVPVRGSIDMGIEKVYDHFKSFGYTKLVDSKTLSDGRVVSDINPSSMALGGMTYGVSIREHTQAYATLANGGMSSKSRTYSVVKDSTGKVLLDNRESHESVYKEATAAIITDLLKGVVSQNHGTAASAVDIDTKFKMEVAGKTGTTNDKKDVWFSGYTPDFVACCWYGYDNNKVITASGNGAAMLWNNVFTEIYKYYDEKGIAYSKKFPVPSSVVTGVEYCALSGKKATEACRNDLLYKITGSTRDNCVATGTFSIYEQPTEECDLHVGVMWDKKTEGICFDGYCNCPQSDLEYVGLRKISLDDRRLEANAYVLDAECIYMDLPVGYIFPTNTKVPYYYNLLSPDDKYHFGLISGSAANRVCSEHFDPTGSSFPSDPPDPNDPNAPADPDNPADPADPNTPVTP